MVLFINPQKIKGVIKVLSSHLLSLSNMGNLHNLLQVINEKVSFINPAKIEGVIKNARARKA